jgi:hypothetical protein
MRFLSIILAVFALPSVAVDYEFLRGGTDKFVLVNMYDLTGAPKTGLAYSAVTATYTRNTGSADVDVTEVTMTMGTHVDGGWIEVDATNSPGLYQFGIPDAAIAAGAESVIFSFKATDTFQRFVHASLIDVNLRNGGNVAANTVQIEGSDATDQINAQADQALADYDAPTNAEMVARTVTAATYATAAALATAQGDITAILADTSAMDTAAELQTLLTGTSGNLPTAAALSSVQSDITAILTDTAAVDTSAEMRTFLTGSDSAVARESTVATAQADLDILTGSNGATLATSQPNYAPYTGTPPTVEAIRAEIEEAGSHLALILEDTATTIPGTLSGLATASALSTHDSKLDTVDNAVDSILADTGELQLRFADMIEADGANWRFTANALEQGPAGGGGGSGDATEANQLTIIDRLDDIMGTGFDTAEHSLVALRTQGDAAWGSGGSGSIPVNHNTGGTDALRFVDGSGAGIEGATIMAYVKEDYDDGVFTMRGMVTTGADGRWTSNLMLDDDVPYTLVFYKPGAFGPTTANVTP